MNLAVSPGGRHVVVAAPKASLVYRLSGFVEPGDLDSDELVTMAELVANERLESGEPFPLTTAEWLERWQPFHERHPFTENDMEVVNESK